MSRNPVRRACAEPHHCPPDLRLRVLGRSPLSAGLSPAEVADLDARLSAVAWAAGEPLMLAGESVAGSYLVVSGRVRLTRDTVDGRAVTVDIVAPGDVIGPLADHPAPATDSAWAMETTCALFLPADALTRIVEAHPGVAVAIMRIQQGYLARSRERETAQATLGVEERVAATLRHLDSRVGQTRRDGSRLLQVRLRRDDIAGMAGTTVESASRVLARMRKAGAIESGREWIALVDPALFDPGQ